MIFLIAIYLPFISIHQKAVVVQPSDVIDKLGISSAKHHCIAHYESRYTVLCYSASFGYWRFALWHVDN